MKKYIREMQNQYSCGHEQKNKRPYLVVYASNDYVLAFPLTTKLKIKNDYDSHKNPLITTRTRQGLTQSEVMIDQLTPIPIVNLMNKQKPYPLPNSNEYPIIIDNFVQQLTQSHINFVNKNPKCPNFFDIINFTHTNPILTNIMEYCVISSSHFNVFTKMCLIAPIKNNKLNLDYLHCIDWKARDISIISNKSQDIQMLQQAIRTKFC